jgi:hypothetical protein
VTRLERWERAAALGLNPPAAASPDRFKAKFFRRSLLTICASPPQVREILMTKEGDEDLAQNVLYGEV